MPTNSSDIFSELSNDTNNQNSSDPIELQLLRSIDNTVKDILKLGSSVSQANASSFMTGSTGNPTFGSKPASFRGSGSVKSTISNFSDEFKREFKKSIFDALVGSDFKNQMQSIFTDLADAIGVSLSDLPGTLGSQLGKGLIDLFKNSSAGKTASTYMDAAKKKLFGSIQSAYTNTRGAYIQYQDKKTGGAYSRTVASDLSHRSAASTKSGTSTTKSIFTSKQSTAPDLSHYGMSSLIINAQHVMLNTSEKSIPLGGGSDLGQVKSMLSEKFGSEIVDNVEDEAMSKILSAAKSSNKSELTKLLGDTFGTFAKSKGVDIGNLAESIFSTFGSTGAASAAGTTAAASAGTATAATTTSATAATGAAVAGVDAAGAASIAGLVGALGTVILPILAVSMAMWALSPAIEAVTKAAKDAKKAADRYNNSREKSIEYYKDRLSADIQTMAEEPFNILKSAANELYDAWDNQIRKINGTQGYSKDDLQTLIGNFAERLREEGLTKVVSASSITENLAKVLDSGLSGKVAEEFAYLATKLNAAIPTQDFFSYASTYSSIAANAIRQGKSQSDAIAEANEQLEGFANNILYASREVAGGFTTGLKDAENLFTQSVQIAQASKSGNATEISAVMTAVSAVTGAIAPDLAQSMTDAIYKAATGGNSSEIVALRSLAGINASNTEFLKQLANDPKSVFANLFSELAKRQNMSQDAYMEVAEGLSSIFGVSADAFARVDFNYLANAISSMDSNSDALLDNMNLLASGQTTTTAEQLKMQQINEYMLDEGLSYVLDNAAARSIQENMWAEQRAQKLMEATYAVELKGSALEFLEGIRKTIDNIQMFVNPVGIVSKVASGIDNLISTAKETHAQNVDTKRLLELGKVGNGNSTSLYQLTTRGVDLNITDDIVTLMGGTSAFQSEESKRKGNLTAYAPWNAAYDAITSGFSRLSNRIYAAFTTFGSSDKSISSAYSWGTIGKSAAAYNSTESGNEVAGISLLKASQSEQANAKASIKAENNNVQKFLGTMESFLSETNGEGSYEDWIKTATRFQISDFNAALEDVGLTNEAVKGQFESYQTEQGVKLKQEREQREDQFWIDNITQLTTANTWLETIYNKQCEFFDDFILYHADFLAYGGESGRFTAYQKAFDTYCANWADYYIKHTAYKSAVGYNSSSWDKVKNAENSKSRDAVYALAAALTKNSVDLLDPTVQTNVLLSEILQIVNAILQQGINSSDGQSLVNSLSAMAIGVNHLK